MNYGYVRVSTTDQNIARQMVSMQLEGISQSHIYIDKQSGKDFERKEYKRLKRNLKKDDCIFVQSIDRFGRNYDEIISEWKEITSIKEANIVVIDMPLLDTRTKNGLVGKLISDLVLQILSFVAETERDKIRQRQAEGIAIARANGVKFGRPAHPLPDGYEAVVADFVRGGVTGVEAAEILNIPTSTFYYKFGNQNNRRDKT